MKTQSLTTWNNSSTTVWFAEVGFTAESNDVRATVVSSTFPSGLCATHFGLQWCIPAFALGAHFTIAHMGAGHSQCNPVADCYPFGTQENSIFNEVVLLNDSAHTGDWGYQWQRQATMVHELGHALSLAHDGIGDGSCGMVMPVTIMDYDCLDGWATNVRTAWDDCGVNHAYYDPNWGYSGC